MMIDLHDNLLLQIAISRAKGMRAPVVRELLGRVGSLYDFFTMSQAELHNISGAMSDVFSQSYRQALLNEAAKETSFVRSNNIDTYLIDSPDYPERLSACEDAPVLLYKLGSCNLNNGKFVAIVGTRHATAYGVDFTTRLVDDLAKKIDNIVIVSGLAYGIDVTAHKAAINAGIPTIAVVAHGLNTIYPADHRDIAARMLKASGAIVTEYSSADTIHRGNFLERNRIVAGLCDCTVVVESDVRGGSMSTARIAGQYSRDVFAMPGRINDRFSSGTNKLIRTDMASLITCADDLIEHMGWDKRQVNEPAQAQLFRALSTDEQAIIDFITANPEATVNDLCVKLGKSYSAVSNILFQLEMDDIIITLPGGRFAVAIKH